jgi:hypothetical protein
MTRYMLIYQTLPVSIFGRRQSQKEMKKAVEDATVNWLRNNNPFPGSVDDPTAQQLAKFPASDVLGHSLLRRRNK